MSPSQFRYTLAAYIVLGFIGGSFDLIFPSAIPEALSNAQETNDANLSTTSLILVALLGMVVIVGSITSFVGLYLFRPWSPRLAVIVTVLSLFVWPLLGVSVASGWSVVLTTLSTTLWGVVLALAYFSPLKERFVATR
jgi:hypothetical protein